MDDSAPEAVAPLDAYATAKPNEPTFTLQGGDPLGAPLVKLWADAARVRCGLISPTCLDFRPLEEASAFSELPNVREQENLQLRATEAEKVSWAMTRYLRGSTAAESPETPAEKSLDEKARLDLHDVRVRYAQQVSGMVADLTALVQDLRDRGWLQCEDEVYLTETIQDLTKIRQIIEPRRLMRRD